MNDEDRPEPRYLCIAPHYWAVGPTLKEAVKNIKRIGHGLRKADIRFVTIPANVHGRSVHVDEIDNICWRDRPEATASTKWRPSKHIGELP